MTFQDLNLSKPLHRAITDLGLSTPTPIQVKAYPAVMSGKDTVAISQTGTGKTFAYLIPIIRQLIYSEQRHPRVLIVVPTRELVVQVMNEIQKLTTYITIRSGGIYGGANINPQKQLLYNGLDILVATPGRLMDMVLDRTLQLKDIQKLVLDEVDELLSLGFRTQLVQLMEKLPLKRQNLLFSATLDEEVEKIIENYFITPQYLELIARGTPIDKITQSAYAVPNFYTKVNLLEHLLLTDDTLKKVLVFCKNKNMANDVFTELEPVLKEQIAIIHSNKTQPQRFAALLDFEKGVSRVLIATDIIARGLDIAEVTHVINFDTPKTPEDYIHRIGRTGRADKIGASITFVTDLEKPFLKGIEVLMNKKIKLTPLPEVVEVSDVLTADEKPVKRDKNLKKIPKLEVKTGAFHEKKLKNQKVQLGGKRRQERLRRKDELYKKNRGI
ncbi:MAG: DEAD/DEAH box helicase [Bacteroidota bacterium]|nr:DEAD/DEAH box helicase [Bacteroidota bacterium]